MRQEAYTPCIGYQFADIDCLNANRYCTSLGNFFKETKNKYTTAILLEIFDFASIYIYIPEYCTNEQIYFIF